MRSDWTRGFVLAALCAGGCFGPSYQEGFPCSELQKCPPGQFCDLSALECRSEGDAEQPQLVSVFPPTTGWTDQDGQPIRLQFLPVSTGVLECRTGPEAMIGMLEFEPCDGADGRGGFHVPAPDPTFPEGSYETQARIRRGAELSDQVSYPFYVHRSLDSTRLCPPLISDALVLEQARSHLASAPPFGNGTVVRNPFVSVPFDGVTVTVGMVNGSGWDPNLTSVRVEAKSLRRRFVLNQERDLLLVRREYESRMARMFASEHSCRNSFKFGGGTDRKFDCQYFVLNSRGQSVCLVPNGADLVPERPSEIGWVKLNKADNFSAKGPADCPDCQPWYLVLPP